MIDQIIAYNKAFVAQKGYEKYITDKYPDKKLAVLSCMDTRLTELLPAALGLKNGDAKIIKNAGGLVISAFDSAMRSLIVAIYELGVKEIMVVAHSHCGACHMSYDHFHHEMIARGVTDETLDTIRNRSKVFSVRSNAKAVKQIQTEFGSFDAYLWSFTEGMQIDGHWATLQEIPTQSTISRKMSADMKRRGISFVGPVITYSFMQSIGMVNDHLKDCEYRLDSAIKRWTIQHTTNRR